MTPTEVAGLMAEILEIDVMAPDESFFDVGGNSFLALTLISAVRERAGVQLRLIDVVGDPTPAGVSELVARAAGDGEVA